MCSEDVNTKRSQQTLESWLFFYIYSDKRQVTTMYKTLRERKTLRICPFFQGVYNPLGKRLIDAETPCN